MEEIILNRILAGYSLAELKRELRCDDEKLKFYFKNLCLRYRAKNIFELMLAIKKS